MGSNFRETTVQQERRVIIEFLLEDILPAQSWRKTKKSVEKRRAVSEAKVPCTCAWRAEGQKRKVTEADSD